VLVAKLLESALRLLLLLVEELLISNLLLDWVPGNGSRDWDYF
jgi:hypothetical protein